MDGFFSIIIIDKKLNDIYLIRDEVGKKPLYYKTDGKKISASSRAFLLLDKDVFLNRNKISRFLNEGEGLVDTEHWFNGVKVLLPGTCMKINLNDQDERSFKFCRLQSQSSEKKLSEHICEAIVSRATTEQKISVATSSGVDSTIIAKLLSLEDISFDYASIGFDPIEDSEIPNLHQKMDLSNDDISPIILKDNPDLITETFDLAIDALETGHSSTAIIAYFQLCKEVSRRGSRVLLEGQGADELFLGYDKYLLYSAFQNIRAFNLKVALDLFMAYSKFHGWRETCLEAFRNTFPMLKNYQNRRWKANRLLKKGFLNISKRRYEGSFWAGFEKYHLHELDKNLVNLLHYGDAIPLYNAIENRNPFCDTSLRRFVLSNFSLSDLVSISGTKKPLRMFSKNFLGLEQPMEKKVGFQTNVVKSLRKSQKYSAQSILDFLASYELLLESADVEIVKSLPDNIYFRFCGLKSVFYLLSAKGFCFRGFK